MSRTIGNRLDQAQGISVGPNASVFTGTVDRDDSAEFYRLRLKPSRSSFSLRLQGLAANADVELIRDRNGNRKLDLGEVVASSRASQRRDEAIALQGLEAGTYFVRVLSQGGRTAYRLSLSAQPTQQTSVAYSVLQRTNAIRQERGLPSLAWNTQLAQAAQSYAKTMAREDFFSHTAANGLTWQERIRAADYDFSDAAENLSIGRPTPKAVVQAWMNSPGHRFNMLAEQVQEMGVGYYFLKNDTGKIISYHYWAESFGTPRGNSRPTGGFNPSTPSNNIQRYLDRISR